MRKSRGSQLLQFWDSAHSAIEETIPVIHVPPAARCYPPARPNRCTLPPESRARPTRDLFTEVLKKKIPLGGQGSQCRSAAQTELECTRSEAAARSVRREGVFRVCMCVRGRGTRRLCQEITERAERKSSAEERPVADERPGENIGW